MANDITTLAIALQSKEAEASMQTFNSLLETGSKNAKNMENMRIGVDVDEALRQLTAFKQSYEDIAKTAQNIHFDLGMNMPAAITPPPVQASGVDVAALEEVKSFFQQAAEEMRRQSEALNESMEKMGAGAERAGQSIRVSGESMRVTGAAASEYAEKLREVNAAKKEMEKLDAKSEADAQAVFEADTKAAEAKRELAKAQKQLADATEKYNTHAARGGGFTLEQLEQYEALQEKVKELKKAYNIAQDEADKLGQKLDVSSAKVEEARQKYEQLKAELAGMPAPVAKAGKTVDTFAQNAKHAGTTMTKMARGFNAVAFAGGAAIPGLSKLGAAISMFAYSGPWVGAAIAGIGILTALIKKHREEVENEARFIRESAEHAQKIASATKSFVSESKGDWERLGELSGMESLTNEQNQEAISIIQRLTEVYGDLGIEIDKTTGKLNGYAAARKEADEMDIAFQRQVLERQKNAAQKAVEQEIKDQGEKIRGREFFLASPNYTQRTGFEQFFREILADGVPAEEQLKRISDRIEVFQKVASGAQKLWAKKEFNGVKYYDQRTPDSSGYSGDEIEKDDAQKEVQALESLFEKVKEYNEKKKALAALDTAPIEEYSKKVDKLNNKLQGSSQGFVVYDELEDARKQLKQYEEEQSKLTREYLDASDNFDKFLNGRDFYMGLNDTEFAEALGLKKKMDEIVKREYDNKALKKLAKERLTDLEQNPPEITYRLKTDEESYNEQKERIAELRAQIKSVNDLIAGSKDGALTIDDSGKEAGVHLAELQVEMNGLIQSTLTYEQRITAEKEKQRKALNDAIDAEQMRVNTFKSGYITNSKGDLIRSKNTDEIAKDRSEEIKELQALINEKGYGETLEEEKELVSARLKLANLQAEQLKYREQVKSANEKNNDARRYYNFDKNGAVIGKKTEEELNKERQKELEAARERVKASKAGTLERAQAQAELDRLAIEDYNARKKTDAAQVVQHAQGVQSRLMHGVQARSTEALALEARSFRRDESEKAILKETKDVNTDIRDTLNNVSETVTRFGEAFLNLNGILQPV